MRSFILALIFAGCSDDRLADEKITSGRGKGSGVPSAADASKLGDGGKSVNTRKPEKTGGSGKVETTATSSTGTVIDPTRTRGLAPDGDETDPGSDDIMDTDSDGIHVELREGADIPEFEVKPFRFRKPAGSRASELGIAIMDFDRTGWNSEAISNHLGTLISNGPSSGAPLDADGMWNHYGGPLLLWLANGRPTELGSGLFMLVAAIDLHARQSIGSTSPITFQLNRFCRAHRDVLRNAIRELHRGTWERRPRGAESQEDVRIATAVFGYAADLPQRCRAVFIPSAEMLSISVAHRILIDSVLMDDAIRRENNLRNVVRTRAFESSVTLFEMDPMILRRNGIASVKFFGEAGVGEGVKQDWFTVVANETMQPDFGIFEALSHDEGTFTTMKRDVRPALAARGKAFGVFMALSLIEGYTVGFNFSLMFYAKLLRRKLVLEDLKGVDPYTYNSVKYLLEAETAEEMGVDQIDIDGVPVDITLENREEVLSRYINALVPSSPVFSAICDGFFSLISEESFRDISVKQVQSIFLGSPVIDVNELKRSFVYASPYSESHPVIVLFWRVMGELDQAQLSQFLRFISGMSYLPLGGVDALPRPFKIVPVTLRHIPSHIRSTGRPVGPTRPVDPDDPHGLLHPILLDRLPTSHTCFFTMDLPAYQSHDNLKSKLLQAIGDATEGGILNV